MHPEAMPVDDSVNPCTRMRKEARKTANAYMMKFSSEPDAIIHHGVGMRRMLHADFGRLSACPTSDAPRIGSCNVSSAGISSSAGTAASTMAARHPKACATGPLQKLLNARPMGTPSMNSASAPERLCDGNRSPSQLVATGAQTASPTATPSREKSRKPYVPATAVDAVSALHTVIPEASSFLRLQRSASLPRGTPITAYSSVKAVVIQPIWVWERLNSLRIGS